MMTGKKIMIALVTLGVIGSGISFARFGKFGHFNYKKPSSFNCLTTTTSNLSLTDEEKQLLVDLRQEEKLARDVYITLYNKYGLRIFSNISRSEQRHTDAIKNLINKYGIEDPVTDDTVGVFKDEKFTNLYNQLVEAGSKSVVDALKVGATIEDLDISDLENDLSKTDKEDLTRVSKNLDNGSYNHMRAFVRMLNLYGATYTPQFISQEEFEAILNGARVR